MRLRKFASITAAAAALAFTWHEPDLPSAPNWLQWGGPNRDFRVSSAELAEGWPEAGPELIWKRPLGEGYSGILVENGVLYTMYRHVTGERTGQEVVVSLDAASGRTLWEHRWEEPLPEKMDAGFGPGPHATPLLVGDRLFAIGAMARLQALEKSTGQLLWSRDLYNEFSLDRIGLASNRGYASSPIAYGDTLILPLGGPGKAVVALSQRDGSLVWQRHDYQISPSSPLLIQVDGETQVVLFMAAEIIGLNPDNGDLLWNHPHVTDYDCNISTPIWGEDNLLYMSSAYNSGSRVIELKREDGVTSVRELWFSKRMRIHFGSAIRLGDVVYGSSGDFGPSFFMGVDVRTGKVLWKQRGLAKSQIVYADGKFLIVDEDGHLVLARPDEQGLTILGKAELLESRAWTGPTLTGSRVYLRDRESIMALDLPTSAAAVSAASPDY